MLEQPRDFEKDAGCSMPEGCSPSEDSVRRWYVMRVTYQRELKAFARLKDMGVEAYVPMSRKVKADSRGHVKGWEDVPLIHGYIFVHEPISSIRILKLKIPPLRYMMGKDKDGKMVPQHIRDKQLEDFRRVVDSQMYDEAGPDVDLIEGDRVRIRSGALEGVEGVFVKLSGKVGRRVVVRIEGVASVVTAKLKSSEVERITQ